MKTPLLEHNASRSCGTTDGAGQEKEWSSHELTDLGAEGITSMILESRQVWIKFSNGTAVTLTPYLEDRA
ncbi:hypothetical protein [Candidatus Poriferisodalis sp.]|uniref:hypothetical protein n=1 Tax=Candidatus Poriferisodalis sp. TaxID=3101277 RepID=UPI003B01CD58